MIPSGVEIYLALEPIDSKPSANSVFIVSLFPRMRVFGGGDVTKVSNAGGARSLDAME